MDVGNIVRTEKIDRYVDGKIVTFYTPKIQVGGKMVCIADTSTESGIKECENRKTALEIAKRKRDELKSRDKA